MTGLVIAFLTAHLAVTATFRWALPLVSVLSLIAIAAVVHPGAPLYRSILSQRWLVAVGQRSYGLYLWHWPIFVVVEARGGSVGRFVAAMALTVVVSEACYRYVETPVRRGAIGRWVATWRAAEQPVRQRLTARVGMWGAATAAVALGLVAFYARVDTFDRAAGGADAVFSVAAATPTPSTAPSAGSAGSTPGSAAPLPRRLVVVGDSQAHSLAINLPDGISSTFSVSDGSVEGCGVLDDGDVRSTRAGFNRSLSNCAGWAASWASAAQRADAQIALVVIGAWDVFDVELDTGIVRFASREADRMLLDGLQEGIDALVETGAHVALLEVPCMRPQDVKGAGVPALPERGDDVRIAHLNDLLREAAAANPTTVTFVPGPPEWCDDATIASDLGYRWDGVHVYKPGANLIYETIAPALLALPVTA